MPNDYDEVMSSFRLKHHKATGVFFGRSPWIGEDESLFAGVLENPCVRFTANMGVNHHKVDYCYHGFDPLAIEAIDIQARPEVIFIAGASQVAVEHQRQRQHHNLYLHTDPPVLPLFYQVLCDTHHPRPFGCNVSGHRAVYWMHYMGCDPIVLLGVDYAGKEGIYYGDTKSGDEHCMPTENQQWRTRMREIVARLRAKGTTVLWPGEDRHHG